MKKIKYLMRKNSLFYSPIKINFITIHSSKDDRTFQKSSIIFYRHAEESPQVETALIYERMMSWFNVCELYAHGCFCPIEELNSLPNPITLKRFKLLFISILLEPVEEKIFNISNLKITMIDSIMARL